MSAPKNTYFKTDIVPNSKAVLLRLDGAIEGAAQERLEATFRDLFLKRAYNIIVEMSSVDFVSSSGVGFLIAAQTEAYEHQGNVILVAPSAKVRRVFTMLNLTSLIHIVDDIASAMLHINAASPLTNEP